MNLINEKRTFNTLRLTDNQKKVMTRIMSSATEKLAAQEISKGRALITARDILVKLQMIDFRDGYAALTSDGEQLMKDYNLTDETGQLTDDGNEFAYEKEEQPVKESLLKHLNAGAKLLEMKNVTPQKTWWKSDPQELLTYIYWMRKQIPPSDKKGAYEKIVNALNKGYPGASDKDLERHLTAFD